MSPSDGTQPEKSFGSLWTSTAFKVGAMVIFVSGLIGVMTLEVSDDLGFVGRSHKHHFFLNDAGGLVKNSGVKMAGVKIGKIKDIQLENGRARVDLLIDPSIKLTKTSEVEVKSSGILGDRYIEIKPGGGEGEPLVSGDLLSLKTDGKSLDQVLGDVGELASALKDVAETIKSAAKDGSRESSLGRIVSNIEMFTQDLADATHGRKNKLGDTLDNLYAVSEDLRDVLGDESEDGFKVQMHKAMAGLGRLDKTMKNVEEISDKINTGQGTIGKLVNDEKTIEEVNTAVSSINSFLTTANRISTAIDFRSEYLADQALVKSYLGLKVKPGLDRFYEIQVVDDPKGVVETVRTDTTFGPGQSGSTTSSQLERKTFKNKVKFSAMFGKNFYDFALRGGLIESSGGAGIDYYLFRRKLRLTFDAFDLGNDGGGHLRTYGRYDFFRGLYLIGGVDDFVSRTNSRSFYLGAGIDITNDDLKTLLQRINF